ncbi:MAG: ATP-grasp domain-containing protein [Patescibacteria group bacterium]
MNLYEWEGKKIFQKYGIATPKGVVVRRGEDIGKAYANLGMTDVIVKAQILSGKRGKNNGIFFCKNEAETIDAVQGLFDTKIRGQYVASVLIEEKLQIKKENYLSITYDTNKKQPVLIYSESGGMDIEDVPENKIKKFWLDVRNEKINADVPFSQELWNCFLSEDARVVEINPLARTEDGRFVAADAKVALDDDAFYRHEEWKDFEPRTMMGRLPTERELAVRKIDEGENYYRGTAGKYIEMDGDVAILFSGGGASIANMDALNKAGGRPANYTEYSGNPPREKVYQLAKIVLSKPGLRGLWIAGGVANFTNVAETFQGIVDALDELKPNFPIVVRRAGPFEDEGMKLMRDCAARNGLNMKLFGKEVSMSETAEVLVEMINK